MKVSALTNKLRWFVRDNEITIHGKDNQQISIPGSIKVLQQAWVDHNGDVEWQDVPEIYELEND